MAKSSSLIVTRLDEEEDLLTAAAVNLSLRQKQLIAESLQIEEEEARAAGALGFMARTLAQVTLPHTNPNTLYYERTNGKLILSVRGHKAYGVPYGSIPRVVLAWICTEAVTTKDPVLMLGRSAAEFSRKLQLNYNGRDLNRLKRQCLALARSIISIDSNDATSEALAFEDIKIATRGFFFWSDNNPEKQGNWESTLTLSEEFYRAMTTRPVPFDMRVFHALGKSPLAMDIYTWLVYRMFVLLVSGRKSTLIPWVGLRAQFGVGYSNDDQGLRNFKKKFRARLKEVLLFYPEANGHIQDLGDHIELKPSRLHIPYVKKKRL